MSGAGLPVGRKLFTIEATFTVHGHSGTLLHPGLVPEGRECFRIGDPLKLRRPDGSELRTAIAGICLFYPRHGEITVSVKLTEAEVPVGAEVWSV